MKKELLKLSVIFLFAVVLFLPVQTLAGDMGVNKTSKSASLKKTPMRQLTQEELERKMVEDDKRKLGPQVPKLMERIKMHMESGTLCPKDHEDMDIVYLGRARDTKAVPLLIEILKNYHNPNARSDEARASAAQSLGWIGDKSAISSLKEVLETDKSITYSVILALVDLGETVEAKTVIKENSVSNKYDFYLMEQVLKKEKDEEIISLLKVISNNEKDKKAWVHAMILLVKSCKIDDEYKAKLEDVAINSNDEYLKSGAICVLRLIGDNKSISIIENALHDHDSSVRAIAIRELEQLSISGNEQAISVIKKALSTSEYNDVKSKAKETLKRIDK